MATETVTVSGLRTDHASWALAAGASKAAAVQTPDDDATSYISANVGAGAASLITFDFASPVAVQSGDTITSVQFTFRRRRNVAGGNNAGIGLRVLVNGVASVSAQVTTNSTSTAWNTVSAAALTNNPVSGVAWTYTDLTQLSLRIAPNVTLTTATLDVSSISATITYTAAAASFTGTATETFAVPAIAATGAQTFSGTASESFAAPVVAASGAQTFSGTAAMAFAVPAIASTGAQTFSGTAAAAFAAPAVDASGAQTFSGLADSAFAAPAIEAEGQQAFTGTASVAFAVPAVDVAGEVSEGEPEAIDGTAGVAFGVPSIDASGTVTPPVVQPPVFSGGGSFGGGWAPAYQPRREATKPPAVSGKASVGFAVPAVSAVGIVTPRAIVGRARVSFVAPEVKAWGMVTPPAVHGAASVTFGGSRLSAFGDVKPRPPAWDEETELDELLMLSAI